MAENSKIEWTHHTFNPWRGCTKVSEGCAHCYAETTSGRNPGVLGEWGPNGKRVVAAEAYWEQPLKWDRDAAAAGERRRVFCASLADVFEDWPGPMFAPGKAEVLLGKSYKASRGPADRLTMPEVRQRLFELIARTPHLDWLLLTKRPEVAVENWPLWAGFWAAAHGDAETIRRVFQDFVMTNVWVGASVENQNRADERIPLLLQIPAAVRFLSCEPLLGPVQINPLFIKPIEGTSQHGQRFIDWIIAGGESGPGARPVHPAWARSLRDQCKAAGVAFFFKQWGEWEPWEGAGAPIRADREARRINDNGSDITGAPELWCDDTNVTDAYVTRVGKKTAGRLLDGREWGEFPRTCA